MLQGFDFKFFIGFISNIVVKNDLKHGLIDAFHFIYENVQCKPCLALRPPKWCLHFGNLIFTTTNFFVTVLIKYQ